MGTKLVTKRNPNNCIELGSLLGHPVSKWIEHGDGSMEIDFEETLTPAQQAQAAANLEVAHVHLTFDDTSVLQMCRAQWATIKAMPDSLIKAKLAIELLAKRAGFEI